MEKAALIFIGILTFTTCTKMLVQSCDDDSDCNVLKCTSAAKIMCVQNICQCANERHLGFSFGPSDSICNARVCTPICRSKGEYFQACLNGQCKCGTYPSR
ncbi:hypothetical protein YC2023_024338 [Brassica napus]